ncbi:hypothetical protein GJAV_G00269360 [Gymnothorax javanicus]|nr:hypothetical protein GJAV_G00269360 [Gymnothorax javanicus]
MAKHICMCNTPEENVSEWFGSSQTYLPAPLPRRVQSGRAPFFPPAGFWELRAHTSSPQTTQRRPSHPYSIRMKSAFLLLVLVSTSWALPFQQTGFMDFMMEDEAGSGLPEGPTDPLRPAAPERPTDPDRLVPPYMPGVELGPVCPFRCQCHVRVTQCSDLGLKAGLHALILVNNLITTIHPKAFMPLGKLQRLYLSKNLLKDMPANMPKSLQELRIHENQISKIKKASFEGLVNVIVMELGSNPLKSSGIDDGAFSDLKRVSYIRIADTNLTQIPKRRQPSVLQSLPGSLSELHLDSNKITKVQADRLKGLKILAKLGLSDNEISVVENGTMLNMPHLRELHLDNNALTSVPPGLPEHKYIKVVYLHNNKIAAVGTEDFCPPGFNTKKAMYSGISLFSNPVPYWEVQPITFRCVFDRSAIQLGNYRKK